MIINTRKDNRMDTTRTTTNRRLTRHNYSNVTKLQFNQNESTFDIKIESSRGYSDHVYFSNDDKELIIKQITDDKPNCIWFDDISYHIRFYRTGMRVLHVFSSEPTDRTYKFDTSVIVDWIENNSILELNNCQSKNSYTSSELSRNWYYLFKDKIRSTIEPDIFDLYKRMIERSKHDDKTAIEFVRMFKGICSWAFQSIPVYLSISFDSYSEKMKDNPSLYWYVQTLDHKRIINGGLIFHHDYQNGEYLESGSYSIHT